MKRNNEVAKRRRHWNGLADLPVCATGALGGTVLKGFRPRCEGIEVVLDKDVKPRWEELEQIKAEGNWSAFVGQVQTLPGFQDMATVDVASWLEGNAVRKAQRDSLGQDEGSLFFFRR